jgi:nucleoside-specific outer membrane channel protein Tsx
MIIKNNYQSILLCLIFFSSIAISEQGNFIQWHTTNAQLLRGFDYKLGDEQRTIITLEHANAWQFGDFFMFADQSWEDNGKSVYYLEPTLRVSLNKLTNKTLFNGTVKDVLLAAQIEKPKGQSPRKLAGLAIDLNLPKFKFFKSHFFIRDNPDLPGDTYQVTLAWNLPFQINETTFLIEGFTDIAGSEGSTVSHQLFVPRILMDVGAMFGIEHKKLWLGFEWQYWHNKFGVDGITESVPQFQMKYVLK